MTGPPGVPREARGVSTTHEFALSGDDTERLLFERIVRAERLVAAQRLCIGRLQARGSDIAQPQALLGLMEAITEQFRTAWMLFRAHPPVPPVRPGVRSTPATPPSVLHSRRPAPAEPPSTLPATDPASFRCPHCGLALSLRWQGDGALVYGIGEWLRLCRHQELQTPVVCQFLQSSARVMH